MVALLAGIAAALVLTAPAMASACGDKVLADWYDDGRIDRIYDAHCYEDAIDAIPKDIGPYVDAEEVITRALQASLRGKLAPGGPDPTPGDDPRTPGGPVSAGAGRSPGLPVGTSVAGVGGDAPVVGDNGVSNEDIGPPFSRGMPALGEEAFPQPISVH